MLVTDESGSMRATDVTPTRLDAARGAAKSFLDKVPDSLRVGLVGYSTIPHTVAAPDAGPRHRALDASTASSPTAGPRRATRSPRR